MDNMQRKLTGYRNKANGALFETMISNACNICLNMGVAHIEKTPEPFHMTKRLQDGTIQGYYEKAGQPDFKGVLCDGTGIMFEAKHTDTDQIKQSVVTEKQWKSLDQYEQFHAHCFVMVSIKLQNFYRVPWNVWKQMKELFGHKYMNETDLAPYLLPKDYRMIHILEGIKVKEVA